MSTLHEDQYTFMIICRFILLRMTNVSDKAVEKIKNQNTFTFSKFFTNILPFMR